MSGSVPLTRPANWVREGCQAINACPRFLLKHIRITEIRVRQHAHQQMEMVTHAAEAHNVHKPELTGMVHLLHQKVLLKIFQGEALQGGTGGIVKQ